MYYFSFPGVEKHVSLAYAREKIKARRKSSSKRHSTHETLETCEPLQFVEFWGNDEDNPIVEDDFTEDNINYSEDENEKFKDSDNVYSDEQGFKYSVIDIKRNKNRYYI